MCSHHTYFLVSFSQFFGTGWILLKRSLKWKCVVPLWNSILVLKMGSLRVLTQDPSKTKVEVHHDLSKEISEFWKYAWCHHMWHSVPFESREEFLCILNMKHSDSEIRFQKSVLTRKYSLCFLGSKKCLCLFVVKSHFPRNHFFNVFFFKKTHNNCINRILWFGFAHNILLDLINRDSN